MEENIDTVIPLLINSALTDSYQPSLESSLNAFNELTTKITREVMISHMVLIASTVDSAVVGKGASEPVQGLAFPKTFEVLWPIYHQALMFGTNPAREAAAKGLVVLVERMPLERLKPHAIKVTGPG